MREKGVFLLLQLYLLTCTRIKHNNFLACYWIVPIVRLNEKKKKKKGHVRWLCCVLSHLGHDSCSTNIWSWLRGLWCRIYAVAQFGNRTVVFILHSCITRKNKREKKKEEEACNHKQGLGKTTSPIIINTPNCYVKYVLPLA